MATKTCPACGHKTNKEADSCPQCGRRGKIRASWTTNAFGVVSGLLILIALLPRTPDRAKPTTETPVVSKLTNVNAASDSEPHISPALQEQKQAVTADERVRIIAAATKGLKRQRDQIEKVTFYGPPGIRSARTEVAAYIGLADGGRPYVRMKAAYSGDRWVFFEQIKIMADDEIVLAKTFRRSAIRRDNATGEVWEIADYDAEVNELVAMEIISKAKSAIIRYSGREREFDHKITAREKTELKAVLQAYKELKEKL